MQSFSANKIIIYRYCQKLPTQTEPPYLEALDIILSAIIADCATEVFLCEENLPCASRHESP